MVLVLWGAALAARPQAAGFVDAPTEPIRCHSLAGQESKCDIVLAALEEAWLAQVDRLGFASPLPDAGLGGSDALDVYLTHDETGGAGGAYVICDGEETAPCVDYAPGDGRQSTPSYVVIDPDTPEADLPRFAQHEFNHVLQYATAFEEPFLDVWEGTAVAAESWTRPDYPLDPAPIADYQATPWVSALLQDGYWLDEEFGIWSYYEYGATVWVRWMDDRLGDGQGSLGPQLWAAMANDPGDNDPDLLDAWDTLSGDWRADFPDFVRMRATLGTAKQPAWAEGLDDGARVHFEPAIDVEPGLTTSWSPEVPLWPLGTAYVRVRAPTGATITVEEPQIFGIVALEDVDGTPPTESVRVPAGGAVGIAVVRLPDPSFDADDPLEGELPVLTVASDDGSGCACGNTAGGLGGGGVLLASLVARSRRRQGAIHR